MIFINYHHWLLMKWSISTHVVLSSIWINQSLSWLLMIWSISTDVVQWHVEIHWLQSTIIHMMINIDRCDTRFCWSLFDLSNGFCGKYAKSSLLLLTWCGLEWTEFQTNSFLLSFHNFQGNFGWSSVEFRTQLQTDNDHKPLHMYQCSANKMRYHSQRHFFWIALLTAGTTSNNYFFF